MADDTPIPHRVREVMTREPVTLTPEQSFGEALALLARNRFRHLLVVDDTSRLAGVLSDRDLLRTMSRTPDLDRATVADVMQSAVVSVEPQTLLSDAAAQMLDRRINCLPVVEAGRLCGILTSTDLLRAFHRLQERAEGQGAAPR